MSNVYTVSIKGTDLSFKHIQQNDDIFSDIFATKDGLKYFNDMTCSRACGIIRVGLRRAECLDSNAKDCYSHARFGSVILFLNILLEQCIINKKKRIVVNV